MQETSELSRSTNRNPWYNRSLTPAHNQPTVGFEVRCASVDFQAPRDKHLEVKARSHFTDRQSRLQVIANKCSSSATEDRWGYRRRKEHPENTDVCGASARKAVAGHFLRGVKGSASREEGGIPQASRSRLAGWRGRADLKVRLPRDESGERRRATRGRTSPTSAPWSMIARVFQSWRRFLVTAHVPQKMGSRFSGAS